MTPPEIRYSAFWPLMLFFTPVLVMDLKQTVKVHEEKLEMMQQYHEALKLQPQAYAQIKTIQALRKDLLQLAPGHPEASQIVAELHLQPETQLHN